jgi:hypothetical protein
VLRRVAYVSAVVEIAGITGRHRHDRCLAPGIHTKRSNLRVVRMRRNDEDRVAEVEIVLEQPQRGTAGLERDPVRAQFDGRALSELIAQRRQVQPAASQRVGIHVVTDRDAARRDLHPRFGLGAPASDSNKRRVPRSGIRSRPREADAGRRSPERHLLLFAQPWREAVAIVGAACGRCRGRNVDRRRRHRLLRVEQRRAGKPRDDQVARQL